ncbi:A-kinase anchor protein 7-like isoform X2 [Brienomyrus brachyistius]|uniref:A-kinase anchor protein 7-like isoform X2 n=1 Tax=Brienomyrus brachyistius TaxID=42636 RepID=UPI0020B20276|nr:A-kinase anchor protein 7-like isoform X2 [Brienomyrus brachyistius]
MYGYNGIKVLRLISKALRLQPFCVFGKTRPGSPAKLQIQILSGRLKLGDLRAVTGPTIFLKPIGIADDMEHRGVSFSRDVQVQTVENDGDKPQSPAGVKGCAPAESKKAKKRRQKRRAKERKQISKSPEYSDSLLAELPFVNEDVWKDLGFSTSEKSQNKKRKRGKGQCEEDDAKKKTRQQRPNYFVSIPISSAEIKGGIKTVQDHIIQKDNRLSRALIPVGSLHITLLVTYLGSEEEVSAAVSAIGQMKQVLQDLLQGRGLVLPFVGIEHFRNEVAFARLASGDHMGALERIAEAVRKAFEERGIPSGESKAFRPHLTFMKLSKAPKLRRQGIRKLDPSLYVEFAEQKFGDETVSRLDLCAMLKKKTPDGYYHCETSVPLGTKRDMGLIKGALHSQTRTLLRRLEGIKQLLSEPTVRASIRRELLWDGSPGAPR